LWETRILRTLIGVSSEGSREIVILIAEDDPGHARLIEKNLSRAGLHNRIERFQDGQAVLDFLFHSGPGPHRAPDTPYLLLLDIRMPKVDGVEVLRRLKLDHELRKLPVIVLTTTDDPREVDRCHAIGCASYIVKPVDYDKFAEAIKSLGLFLSLVQIPEISGGRAGAQG
jgi:CheY-like chemotaxis protein